MFKLTRRYQNNFPERQRNLWHQTALTVLKIGGAVTFVMFAPSVAHGLEIEMVTDPFVVSDSNNCDGGDGPRAAYVGFRVTNDTGSTVTDLEATITGATTDFSLTGSGNQLETQYIGTLNANDSRTVYWHIEYPCHTNTGNQPPAPSNTFTVTVTDANTSAVIDSGTGTVTSNSSISANAGGQIISATLGDGAVLGQVITYDVVYSFGNVQNLDRFNIQPAGNTDFRSDCFQLLTTEILASEVNAIQVGDVDRLFYESDTAQGGSGNTATVRYYFLYLCDGVTSSASPYSAQTSGDTNMKYTGNFEEAGTTISFPPATNSFSVTKSVTPDLLTTGGTATYTITITNNSTTFDARIDRITDVLPSGVTFGTTITGIAGTVSEPSNGDTGTIEWLSQSPDFFEVPAGQSIQLVYTATIPDVDDTYTNSAKAGFGVSETSPATIDVIVGAVPPTIDLDGDDSSGATNNDFDTNYTLGGSAVKVVDADNADETLDTVIADSDSTQLSQAVITLTNDPSITGDAITIDETDLSAIASGAITADTSVANQITLNGNADLADYEAALELIEFSTIANDTTSRTFTFQVTDTDNLASNVATTNISIQAAPTVDLDYGDAPINYDDTDGSGTIDGSDNPAEHEIDNTIYLGSVDPDAETSPQSSTVADGDDDATSPAVDDEDGIATPFPALDTDTTNYSLDVTVNNTSGSAANVYAWLDFDGDGEFDEDERATVTDGTGANPITLVGGQVPTGESGTVTLNWSNIGTNFDITNGDSYVRVRVTTDDLDATTETTARDDASLGAATDGEVEDYQIAIASASAELILVKRITAINPGQSDEVRFNTFVDDPDTDSDNQANWPSDANTYLPGRINVTDVKPGDEVEYTIYFLSNGSEDASNVRICDVIPDNMTFIKDAFGTELGIALGLNSASLPTASNFQFLSNLLGDDRGEFYGPGTIPPSFCQKTDPNDPDNLIPVTSSNDNVSGAVLIKLDDPMPPATDAGTPANSYGLIRFSTKVR